MSNPKDGGPAYPAKRYEDVKADGETYDTIEVTYSGQSVRDYMAGQALAGFCSLEKMHDNPKYMAIEAYRYADAMIEERARGEEK